MSETELANLTIAPPSTPPLTSIFQGYLTSILCDLEPTSSEYLFGENINESLKLGKENYKLSQNLTKTGYSTKHEETDTRNC